MPSSWDIYYVVFLSALLALGVPALLGLVSYLVSAEGRAKNSERREKLAPLATPSVSSTDLLGRRINARFFMGVNASLVLIALALALIPCAGMLQQSTDREGFLRGLVAIISLAAFCGLGLLYSSRKGDLGWVQSFQKQNDAGTQKSSESPLTRSE